MKKISNAFDNTKQEGNTKAKPKTGIRKKEKGNRRCNKVDFESIF